MTQSCGVFNERGWPSSGVPRCRRSQLTVVVLCIVTICLTFMPALSQESQRAAHTPVAVPQSQMELDQGNVAGQVVEAPDAQRQVSEHLLEQQRVALEAIDRADTRLVWLAGVMVTFFGIFSGLGLRLLMHSTRAVREAEERAASHLVSVQAAGREIDSARWVIKAVSYLAQADASDKGPARTILYQMAHQALTEALRIDPLDGAALIWKAWTLKRLGNVEEALGYALQAVSTPGLPQHESARAYYNAACYSSLLSSRSSDHEAEAIDLLAKAIAMQEVYRKLAKEDPDFEHIRDHARFRELADGPDR